MGDGMANQPDEAAGCDCNGIAASAMLRVAFDGRTVEGVVFVGTRSQN